MSASSNNPGKRPTSVRRLMQLRNTGNSPDRGGGFTRVLAHARMLYGLEQKLAAIMDPALSSHCQVADVRDHCLILCCSSATFATRVRMISQPLLESLREAGVSGIERIDIRISPVNRPQPEARRQRTLSPAAHQALDRFAADCGDAEIQAIVKRINARRNR